MDWSAYASFLGLATLLVLVPGTDSAVPDPEAAPGQALAGWRQGFLSNTRLALD